MRILIVGCGYVGLPLGANLVRRGHGVFGLRRSSARDLQTVGITPLLADVTRPATLVKLPRDFDWVVNCAASAGSSAADYRRLYFEGNRNLIAWLSDGPPKKFVFTSSTSVYGQNDGSTVTENSPAEPETETAKVLVETEEHLLEASGTARERSPRQIFPAVILRVAAIYGTGRGHWFKQFLRGEAHIEGDGSRWLNMIHRDDVVGAILSALECGVPGEIYNAADNEPVTQLKFFEWLAAELKRPLPPKISDGEIGPRKRGATNKRVSNEKLRRALQYEFRFPDFRAGYANEIARLNASEPRS